MMSIWFILVAEALWIKPPRLAILYSFRDYRPICGIDE